MNQSLLNIGYSRSIGKGVLKRGGGDLIQNLSFSGSITGNCSCSHSQSGNRLWNKSWSRGRAGSISNSRSQDKNGLWLHSGSRSWSRSRGS